METSPPHTVPARPHLARRTAAEFVGTGLLVTVVVGSGIAAQQLSAGDVDGRVEFAGAERGGDSGVASADRYEMHEGVPFGGLRQG